MSIRSNVPNDFITTTLTMRIYGNTRVQINVNLFRHFNRHHHTRNHRATKINKKGIQQSVRHLRILTRGIRTRHVGNTSKNTLRRRPLTTRNHITKFNLTTTRRYLPSTNPRLNYNHIHGNSSRRFINVRKTFQINSRPSNTFNRRHHLTTTHDHASRRHATPIISNNLLNNYPFNFTRNYSSFPSSNKISKTSGNLTKTSDTHSPVPFS